MRTPVVPRPLPNKPKRSAAKPSAARIAEPAVRKRAKRDGGSVAPSRTAAIGGTRVARIAGRRLATSGHDDADEQRDDHCARREDRSRCSAA